MFQSPYFYPHHITNIPFTMSRRLEPNSFNGLTREIGRNITGRGLFSRFTNPINFIKNINWVNFINNTSKTLGVINQTIPLVKQASPMLRNIKSVLKLASVFKDETDPIKNKQIKKEETNQKEEKMNTEKKEVDNSNNQPTFFIN